MNRRHSDSSRAYYIKEIDFSLLNAIRIAPLPTVVRENPVQPEIIRLSRAR